MQAFDTGLPFDTGLRYRGATPGLRPALTRRGAPAGSAQRFPRGSPRIRGARPGVARLLNPAPGGAPSPTRAGEPPRTAQGPLPIPDGSVMRRPGHPDDDASSPRTATWRSGYAADCKSAYGGSIPSVASSSRACRRRPVSGGRRRHVSPAMPGPGRDVPTFDNAPRTSLMMPRRGAAADARVHAGAVFSRCRSISRELPDGADQAGQCLP